ncbi:biopolymer transporter ExbD [filamentous cyanobacterium CCP5]|nr:biopolymer transporter ExbD [filamentous cyanobacterium CCP5]
MKFKYDQRSGKIPQVDLIPMLTVMMGVLAFFVVVTMTLGTESLIEVQLPAEEQPDAAPADLPADPFIVEMGRDGELLLNGQPSDSETIKAQIQTYLERSPQNTVFLLPDQDLPYEQVMQFLGEMRQVGGDRVSLAIEEN